MRSSSALKVVSIYSIVIGVLGLIGSFNNQLSSYGSNAFIFIVLIVLSILSLSIQNLTAQKVFMIIIFVFYCLMIGTSLIILVLFPGIGLLVLGLFVVPFIYGIIYLVKSGKERVFGASSGSSNYPSLEVQELDEEVKFNKYELARKMEEQNELRVALRLFEEIRDYKDSYLHILNIKEALIRQEKEHLERNSSE